MSEIADLFAADPLSLTKEDRAKIIAHQRANRAAYVAVGKVPKAAAEPKVKGPKLALDLGMLKL